MSGGFKMRVLLAKLLTCHYDILLLDEPTNYLDLAATIWLKDYLKDFKGTFIVVSHDLDFLNEVTNYTLVLENGLISKVKGGYENYLAIRRRLRTHMVKQFKEQEKKRKELLKFIQRFHAQPNKATQARAKKRMLDKMRSIVLPSNPHESIRAFHFPEAKRSGYRTIELRKISKSYKDTTVYKDFDFEMTRGEKAVLVGENGAGKSTLLKLMAGVIDSDSGERILGHNVRIGYFSQTRMDILNEHNTVLKEASISTPNSITDEQIKTILSVFLFNSNDVDKRVSILSGGEKSRLILAKFLVNPPNFLLLDEPTTHLDTDAIDALIKALNDYTGTLVFISHDIHFVRSTANIVFEVKNGEVRKFPGNFDYYWQKIKTQPQVPRAGAVSHFKPTKKIPIPEEKPEEYAREQKEKTHQKEHNIILAKKIKKLRKQRGKLEVECNVKTRIISNPRHSQDIIKYYTLLVKELEQQITKITHKINRLESQFL